MIFIDKAKIKENIEYFLYNVCSVASVILLFGYTILSAFGALPSFFSATTLLFSYATTITLFFIGLGRKVDTNIKSVEYGKTDTKEAMTDIKNYMYETKTQFENLNKTLTERHEEDAKVYVIDTADELYEKLGDAIKHAERRVLIMHLDPFSPKHYDNPARTEYFKLIFDFIKSHPQITMKRITSLCEIEKVDWLKEIMKDTENIEKLDIAYIDVPNLEKSFLSTLVSCQIIDEDKIFLLNPMGNTVPACGTYGECLYIKSKIVVKVYERYYDKLWNEAQRGYGHCCMLKSGKTCMNNELDKIRVRIEEQKYAEQPQTTILSTA